MSLYNFIQNLQRKPKHIRKRIVVGISVVLLAGFISLWVATLDTRLAQEDLFLLENTAEDEQMEKENTPGVFASLAHGISLTFSDARQEVGAFLYKTEQIFNPKPVDPTVPRQNTVFKLPLVQ